MPRSAKRKASESLEQSVASSKRCTRASKNISPPLSFTACFDDLPEELILEILDQFLNNFYNKTHVKALYSLSLTNRRLYRLVKPYLYSIVDNLLLDPGKFLRTALHAPWLAERVRYLHWIDDHAEPYYLNSNQKFKLSQIERRELCKRIEELGLPNSRLYSRAFEQQKSKDHLMAMILLLPNVRCLDVCDTNVCCYPSGYASSPPWIRLLSAMGMGFFPALSQHFQHLHTVRLRMGPIRLSQIPAILCIPSLRNLMLEDIFQAGKVPSCFWDWQISARSSPIEHLYLENSYIDSDAVAQLVGSVRNLQLFCFEFDTMVRSGSYRLFDDDPPKLSYPTIGVALIEHKDTLEQLSIEDSSGLELHEFLGYDPECFSSLRDLHRVRYLDIAIDSFQKDRYGESITPPPVYLSQSLPCNIEQLDLCIVEDEDDFVDGEGERHWIKTLRELAFACKTNLPQLRGVRLARRDRNNIVIDDHVEKVKDKFEKQGVCLEIRGEQEYAQELERLGSALPIRI